MRVAILLLSLVAVTTVRSAESKSAVTPLPLPDPDRAGQELAAKLRDAMPEADSSFSGTFQITTSDDTIRIVPITSTITATSTNWTVTYRATPTNGALPEVLTILHTPGQPSRYSHSVGTAPVQPVNLAAAFAGSDFSITDLGLEFFHWPKQRREKHEMRHSRNCHVLESVSGNPSTSGYARVMSWVDIESGGIVRAEAYDKAGKKVKEFKVGHFRKVDGRWHLESMKIWTPTTGQETELKFDLNK